MNKYKLEAGKSILMIIDLQEKLMKVMNNTEQIYKHTLILLETARVLQIPIIVTEQYPQGLGQTVSVIKEKLPAEYVYADKISFSACTDKVLAYIRKHNRQQVIVVGAETHVCVFQTVRDLIAEDLSAYIIKDAVCSRFELNYCNALEMMRDMGAVVSNTETAVFDLLQAAGTPEFKAISPLIK